MPERKSHAPQMTPSRASTPVPQPSTSANMDAKKRIAAYMQNSLAEPRNAKKGPKGHAGSVPVPFPP